MQHGLRLDAALEFLVQTFDCICGACGPPLAVGQPCEGEQPVSGFLQAIGDRTTFQPPFADERLATCLDLIRYAGVDHVVVVGRDFLMQSFWSMSQKVPVLVYGAALHQRGGPHQAQRLLQSRRTVDDDKARR